MDLNFLNKIQSEISSKYQLLEVLPEIIPDGFHCHRIDSKKHGDKAVWLYVSSWDFKGNLYYKASFGSWQDGSKHEIKSYEKNIITKEFNKKEQEVLKDSKEKMEKEKTRKHSACADRWGPFFKNLNSTEVVHGYLLGKQISSNHLAKVTSKGVLFIPAYNAGPKFVGGQQIFLDPESNKYIKRFTSGIEKIGSFCPFGNIREAKFIYVCEGFATACSVYEALKGDNSIAVVCVWDTGNIFAGAKSIRDINKDCKIVFCADRDTNINPKLDNIGYKKASYASKKIINSIVKMVKFKSGNDTWTDFNDLHCFESLEEVKNQLVLTGDEFIDIMPLGFKDDLNYMFSSQRSMILKLTKADYTPTNIVLHAPESYWANKYGSLYNKEGEPIKGRMDFKKTIEGISRECIAKGHFSEMQVRSTGVWLEGKELSVNLGDKIYHQDEYKYLYNNDVKSKYFYESSNSIKDFDFDNPIGEMKALEFVNAFKMLSFKNPSDSIILLGWLYCAQVFSALPWRPHLWITGKKGSGKSTILEYITKCIPFSNLVQNSTASGIRQSIKNSAMVTVYDESEPNTKKDRALMSEVITMARQSSKNGDYKVLRGSASGNAVCYNTNTNFCFGSIQTSDLNEADISRFFIIEMDVIDGQDPEAFYKLEGQMDKVSDMANELFVRAVVNFPALSKNINIVKKRLKKNGMESRRADQLSPIISGYYGYFSEDVITDHFIDKTEKEITYYEVNKDDEVDESETCLNSIMDILPRNKEHSVGSYIDMIRMENRVFVSDTWNDELATLGMKYYPLENLLFVSNVNINLKRALDNSQYQDYRRVLKRHKGFVDNGESQRWINGKNTRGIFIRM